jgi:cation:H+ antiporter
MEYLLLILGFILLIKGADMFVEGASNIAKFFKIPTVIIGLTLVAFGTSAPEAAVSITAAINGNSDIAISNIVGSCIFNLFCVLGITALFKDIIADKNVIKKDYKLSIFSSLLLLVLILINYFFTKQIVLGRISGLVLLVVLIIYLINLIKGISAEDKKKIESKKFSIKDVVFIIAGLACVVLGGDFTVDNATIIAKAWGLSDRFIGLTVVAIGTSLPELVTSLVALIKGENDIAVGNVIGSNIFNILFILGASSLLTPMNIGIESIIDLMLLIIGSIAVLLFFFSDFKIKRHEAMSMLMLYGTYFIYIFLR